MAHFEYEIYAGFLLLDRRALQRREAVRAGVQGGGMGVLGQRDQSDRASLLPPPHWPGPEAAALARGLQLRSRRWNINHSTPTLHK